MIVLSLVTWLAPEEYIRAQDLTATDEWNRVISTFGQCQSASRKYGGAIPYLLALVAINIGVLGVSNFQAYQARSIQSGFSESRYIGIAMASMLQTAVIVCPVLLLIDRSPVIVYMVRVCAIFLVTMVTVLCIFGPKMTAANKYSRQANGLGTKTQSQINVPFGVNISAHGNGPRSSNFDSQPFFSNHGPNTNGLKFTVINQEGPMDGDDKPATRSSAISFGFSFGDDRASKASRVSLGNIEEEPTEITNKMVVELAKGNLQAEQPEQATQDAPLRSA